MKLKVSSFYVPVFLLGLFLLGIGSLVLWKPFQSSGELIKQAEGAYYQGEIANTIEQRTNAFNQALFLYRQLEAEHNPSYGNGRLYFDIANSYFQVQAYPMAILYYYRALKLMPHNESVVDHLNQALKELSLPPTSPSSIFEKVFFFHNYLSLPRRLQIFYGYNLFFLILLSVYVWWRPRFLVTSILIGAACWMTLLFSLGYERYISPIEGVLIESTLLYRDASSQQGVASDQPVWSGSKLKILEVLYDGYWLKVITPSGDLGYVPSNAIRLI